MQVSTLGIIPPEIVPSAINARASSGESCLISLLDLSSTPGTSVSKMSRFALSAPAIAPAKVSALTLYVPPWTEPATEDLREHGGVDLLGLADEAEVDHSLDVGLGIDDGAVELLCKHHVAVL